MTSISVDSWALGCVASFCRDGRPPFFGDREQVRRHLAFLVLNKYLLNLKHISHCSY